MPDPLARAAMRISLLGPDGLGMAGLAMAGAEMAGPGTLRRAKAVFSAVSVVRMAWATCWKWSKSEPRAAARPGRTAMSFSAGRGTPMTPVEDGKTSSGRQWKSWAAAAQVARAAARPASPAAQLAVPALRAAMRTRAPGGRGSVLWVVKGGAG